MTHPWAINGGGVTYREQDCCINDKKQREAVMIERIPVMMVLRVGP